MGFHVFVGFTNVKRTAEERMMEKIGNVIPAKKVGLRFFGERASAAQAVNHPITKTKMKTPKKNCIAAASTPPITSRTRSAKILKNNINATDIPVRIAKKLSKRRRDGCLTSVFNHAR